MYQTIMILHKFCKVTSPHSLSRVLTHPLIHLFDTCYVITHTQSYSLKDSSIDTLVRHMLCHHSHPIILLERLIHWYTCSAHVMSSLTPNHTPWKTHPLIHLFSTCYVITHTQSYSLKERRIIMVHSYLMVKSMLNENLGGILGGIQC
jgi:hypothetical protein